MVVVVVGECFVVGGGVKAFPGGDGAYRYLSHRSAVLVADFGCGVAWLEIVGARQQQPSEWEKGERDAMPALLVVSVSLFQRAVLPALAGRSWSANHARLDSEEWTHASQVVKGHYYCWGGTGTILER